jgi:hypothetical protein
MKSRTILAVLALLPALFGAGTQQSGPPPELVRAARGLFYAPSVRGDPDRLEAIVAEVYETAADHLLFTGSRAREATALLLYSVMYHESGLRPHIERCDCSHGDGDCDKGHAYGLPQLHAEHFPNHTTDEVCSDRRLQIRLAAQLLAGLRYRCSTGMEAALGAWNSGDCQVNGVAASIYRVLESLLQRARIRVHVADSKWVARRG